MGRFWRIFFASFFLIRKVLCDGCAAKANKKARQRNIETMAVKVEFHGREGDSEGVTIVAAETKKRRRQRENPNCVKSRSGGRWGLYR
jgi:hypothetical protein